MHNLFKKTRNSLFLSKIFRKVFFILLTLTIQYSTNSQWIQQTSGVNSSLYDVYFLNTQTGWSCGANGVILKTTNGGTNWNSQNSGINRELRSIYFINQNTGYTVSRVVGYILKTTNSGTTWVEQYSTSLRSFNNIFALDSSNVWVTGVGVNGYIYKSTNGGSNWDSIICSSGNIYDIFFFTQMNGISTFGNSIYKTTDGGFNWAVKYIGLGELPKLTFYGNTGYTASTSYRIYKTNDLGDNWSNITQITGDGNLHDIFFNNPNTGWLCGDVDNMYKTTDGGFNWIRQNTQSGVFLNSVFFPTDSIGWTCGALGKIFKTNTSGAYVGVAGENGLNFYEFDLKQNYPNPFNPSTKIQYEIPKNGFTIMTIYNTLGQKLFDVVKAFQLKGIYSVEINIKDFPSGVYFYILSSNGLKKTKAMVFLK